MNLKLFLFLLICLQFSVTSLNAQAYDGYMDRRIFLAYTNIGGKSGMEFRYEYGESDIISYGSSFYYLMYKQENSSSDEFAKTENFIARADFGLCMNFHLFPVLIETKHVDPYFGPSASLKSLGLQAGVKYHLAERLGVYGQVLQSFSSSFMGLGDGEDDFINNFGKKTYLSAGLTFLF
jgi:hypothetical protein